MQQPPPQMGMPGMEGQMPPGMEGMMGQMGMGQGMQTQMGQIPLIGVPSAETQGITEF
jgi:hypothetical protein